MGLEAFVEATEDGKPVYEKSGFAVMNSFSLDPQVSDPSAEWLRLRKNILPLDGYFMWRPIGGKYEEGKTVIPWKAEGSIK